MPSLALANWMWLGRVAPEYRDISLGTRLLLGLGRPMIRKLYLGRGPRDEVQQGFQGNTMIMAQPRATYAQVFLNADVALQSLIVMFCNSVDDVSRAHTLVVNRSRYVAGMQRRIRVCPTFADVVLDPTQLQHQLQEEVGVPPAVVQAAVPMPEIRHLNTTRDGPATRRAQFGPVPEESESDASSTAVPEDSQSVWSFGTEATSGAPAAVPEDDRNEYEQIIGMDTHEVEPEERLSTRLSTRGRVS